MINAICFFAGMIVGGSVSFLTYCLLQAAGSGNVNKESAPEFNGGEDLSR